ncbi:hypothetical protein ACGFI4_04905 [Micromonospora carbonacea]|uniref:hypothetical protein n=1 Tax=Micromonospora carbonacea TaxID=47853 RepID=UPI00372321EB
MALPDYPSLKQDISAILSEVVERYRDAQLGPFARSPRMHYHEGDTADFSTVQGEVKDVEFRDFSLEQRLTLSALPTMTHEEILGIMASFGSDFGSKVARSFHEHLGQTLEEAGQTVSIEDGPIDADFLLRVLESLEIDFDDNGNPNPLDFVGGSGEVRRKILQIQSEDERFQEKSKEIMDRKREQWSARESNRKLVD